MDYEKLYKEALVKAQKELQCCGDLDCDAARQIFRLFPELRESNDERIRKTLKSFFDSEISDYGNVEWRNGIMYGEIVAWLEKQGEQKSNNNTKPKFKVGDWITNGEYTWKVIEVKPLDYILQSQNGNIVDDTISHVDTNFSLWTIENAKDGDVLAFDWTQDNGASHWQKIVIFKGLNKDGIEGYGNTFKNGKLASQKDVPHYSKTWTMTLQPATKEQRDFLFQKMHEVGYEWYAETKQLIKIQ